MFCCMLLYVPSSFAIILMGKRELVALLSLSSWCLMIVVWLFLAVPWVCLQSVIVVFPVHIHLLFFSRTRFFLIRSKSFQLCIAIFMIHAAFHMIPLRSWYISFLSTKCWHPQYFQYFDSHEHSTGTSVALTSKVHAYGCSIPRMLIYAGKCSFNWWINR